MKLRSAVTCLPGAFAVTLALATAAGCAVQEARPGPGRHGASITAVLADYERSQSALLAASRRGASATVSILGEDGLVHYGHDVFFSEPHPKILEVRDTGTSMQIGLTACRKGTGDDRFHCLETEPLRIGLFEAPRERIVKVWSEDIACTPEEVPCRFLKLRMLATNKSAGGREDADLVGRDHEVLLTLSDHRPVFLRQVNRTAIGSSGTALFVFDFDKQVAPFELPPEARQEDEEFPSEKRVASATRPGATSSSARTDP